MKYPAYPKYKDSGVQWLGEVPVHWEVKPLKYFTDFINGMAFKPDEWSQDGIPIIRIENLNGGNNFNYFESEVPRRYHVNQGDLLFGWSGNRGTSFGPFRWNREGLHYLNQHIFRFAEFNCDKSWFYWTLKAVTKTIEDEAHGIIGMVHVTKGKLGGIPIPYIPSTEQTAIADFLDRETGRIDTLVAKKRRLIALLGEKRTALISRTVTHGLPADAAREFGLERHTGFKDTGIEWLGEVPEGWEATQLRRKAYILDCKHRTVPFIDDGIPLVSIREVHGYEVDLTNAKQTSEEEYLSLIEGDRRPRLGDIIYSRNATVGDAALVTTNQRFCMGQDVCLIRTAKHHPRYLLYLFRSAPLLEQVESLMIGSTFRRINIGQIHAFWICVPPRPEQTAIATYLDRETTKIDQLVAKVEAAIVRLLEYRTALITAAVTGKIDVRGKADKQGPTRTDRTYLT